MAIRELRRPGPIMATMAMAKECGGERQQISMQEHMQRSAVVPCILPGAEHRAEESRHDHGADAQLTRPRAMENAIRTSRPRASVPKGVRRAGGLEPRHKVGIRRGVVRYDDRAQRGDGAKEDDDDESRSRDSIRQQTTDRCLERLSPFIPTTGSRASVIADAWVDHRVQQVGQQVDEDEDRRDEERGALDDRIVSRLDRSKIHRPIPGQEKMVSVRMAPASSGRSGARHRHHRKRALRIAWRRITARRGVLRFRRRM